MTKKIIAPLITFLTSLVLLSGHVFAQNIPKLHIATSYHKTGSSYNIVTQGKPGDKLVLYVNDKSPAKATVNERGWATFTHVKLTDSGKISFTKVIQNRNGSVNEHPINFTEHYTTKSHVASFTPNNVRLHIAIAYYKGDGSYDIVVNGNPGEKLELYVNDKNPTRATVNNDNWATFRDVKLTNSGKISFTHDYRVKGGSTAQRPINYTEQYTVSSNSASFTPNKPGVEPAEKPTTVPVPTSNETASAPNCVNGTYMNSAGDTVCRPQESSSVPAGATARCVDGTYSFSQSRRGTCSHHGGVAEWL